MSTNGIITSALTNREWLGQQRQVTGETVRIIDLSQPPRNRAERRMIQHLNRIAKKLKK